MNNDLLNSAILATPLGDLTIRANQEGLTEVVFAAFDPHRELAKQTLDQAKLPAHDHHAELQLKAIEAACPVIAQHLQQAVSQLTEYFQGRRRDFQLALAPQGTQFQHQVWHLLQQIPFGETWSYGAQATRLGKPNASRAVGAANGKNPLAIVVPCHRVIAANQRLTGYAGGLSRKLWLLRFEKSFDKNE